MRFGETCAERARRTGHRCDGSADRRLRQRVEGEALGADRVDETGERLRRVLAGHVHEHDATRPDRRGVVVAGDDAGDELLGEGPVQSRGSTVQ